ncbi:MAG: septum formation initiator family protein [Candidatus Nomurabacteria bacterium]|nr:septum formation initiator family protein [Candidatus Nomurabacteria bacterium]
MRSFQKSEKLKHVMQSKLFLIFLGIVILVFVFSVFSFWGKMEETSKNKKIAEDKIAELEKSKEKLNSDIANLKTEKGVEENIRNKFGLAKEGENMILVVDDKSSSEVPKNTDSGGFFSWLKNLLQ